MDQLQAMSAEQIQQLVEKNAERLQVNIEKLVTTTPGVEMLITIQGRKTAAPLSPAELCPSIQRGMAFLNTRYNPALGLLNESPIAAPHKYWLANDNALAAYAFYRLGQPEMSTALEASLRRYGYEFNGLIEVVGGKITLFPPNVASQALLEKVGRDEVWQELHTDGPLFEDWARYSDLGFLGALNEFNQGHNAESLTIFANTLTQFDDTGFQDKAFNGQYETYKLALALYTGATLHAIIPKGNQILTALQAMQAADGGFITHYRDVNSPLGDANTETTALALIAEGDYGCALH